jgi:hypothetical protein
MKPIKAANRAPKGQRITFTHALAYLKQRNNEKSISNNRFRLGLRAVGRFIFNWN